jgi:dTMP kinase
MAKANNTQGLYVVFDGIIGCGKSAQIGELKRHLPLDFPNNDIVFTNEPGGNVEADKLRQRLKYEQMSGEEEMRLFAQSRAITIPEVVVPVLERGGVVISDRSFTTSLAYQAFGGRELGVDKVWQANQDVVNGVFPDLLVYLKVGLEASLRRSNGDKPDKFDKEGRSFWERNVEGFSQMIDFLGNISPDTKVFQIDDPEGKLSIEETRLIVKELTYPYIKNTLHR